MESIKQEIINSVYENGKNLITGPVLQEVLLDMVDDVNDKVASASAAIPGDLVEKTGSWDDAADWVEENSSSLVHENDLDGYATEQWVEDQGYLKEVPEGYATTESLNDLSESVAQSIADIPEPDLSNYVTKPELNEATESVKDWVEAKHYLTTASLSGSVTEESVGFMIGDATASVKTWVGDQNYATETFVSQAIAEIPGTDLTGYATEAWVEEQGYLKEHQDISGLATTQSVTSLSESVAQDFANLPDVSGLATTESVNQLSESVAQTIENLPQPDLSGYLQTSSYLVDSASFDSRIKDAREEATAAITSVSEGVVALSASFDQKISEITGSDLSGYLQTSSYLVDSASFDSRINNALQTAEQAIGDLGVNLNSLSSSVANDFANLDIPDVSGYATTQSVNTLSASFAETIDNIPGTDLTGYATEQWVQDQGYLTEHQDISGLATTSSVSALSSSVSSDIQSAREEASQAITGLGTIVQGESDRVTGLSASFDDRINNITGSSVDLSGYATTESVNSLSASFTETIDNITETSLWKRGAASYSLEQIIDPLGPNSATGIGSLAEGFRTIAKGNYSHAEGNLTVASGNYSHAEGSDTQAKGNYSHAEGASTIASGGYSHAEGYQTLAEGSSSHAEGRLTVAKNWYETAVGIFNATESGQIFSVGIGNQSGCSRQNGLTIIRNSPGINECGESKMYVYGVGGYNGFSTASALDLATVINSITSSGGSGVDTDLRNFLFGVESQTLTGITGSCTNIYSVVSSDTTLGFSAVPDNGTSLGIIIKNEGGSNATITLPDTVTVGSTTYNLITNGVDNSGSMSIPSGEYGDIVVTRQGTDLFVRTSINLEDIDINLSGYATTESVNTLSASFDQRISSIPGSDIDLSEYATTESVNTLSASFAETIDNIPTGSGASGNYLPITGGTLTGNLFVGGNNSIGVGTTRVGNRSLAVGNNTTSTAGGTYALAVGENCQTDVYGGVALGRETRVNSEPFGVATGFRTRVDKMSGFAGGCLSTASGQFSFAAGFGAVSKGTGQVVLGSFNEIDGTGTGTGSYAVILGNGKSSTWNQDNPGDVVRSNGLAIKWDGGIDINYSGSTITLQNKIAELEATIAGLVARIEALEGSN